MHRGIKSALTRTVCSRFCSYYKPGRNEELACRGYVVLERLAQQGVSINRDKTELPRDGTDDGPLVSALCMACPFHEHDCDFMENRALPPCGGFLLLAQLLTAKDISLKDVK